MREILISIKEKWAERIFDGEKRIELRRTRPADIGAKSIFTKEEDDLALICYNGAIQGYCRLDMYQRVGFLDFENDAHIGSFTRLLDVACLTKEEWKSYAPKFAWWIYFARKFHRPVKLSDIGIKRAPQSWQYVTHEQAEAALKGGRP